VRNPQGYATLTDSASPYRTTEAMQECDTFTCGHCNCIVHVPVKADPAVVGGMCKQCMTLICPRCVNKLTCTPWEHAMQIMEAKDAALRSYGLRN
jgi:hypothetical protein